MLLAALTTIAVTETIITTKFQTGHGYMAVTWPLPTAGECTGGGAALPLHDRYITVTYCRRVHWRRRGRRPSRLGTASSERWPN